MKSRYITLVLLFLTIGKLNGQNSITIYPDKDAVINDDASCCDNTNYGSSKYFEASRMTNMGMPFTTRSLIEFDLSEIPEGAIITDASLTLTGDNHFIIGQPTACYMDRISESWDESQLTWMNQPAVSTSPSVTLNDATTTTQNYELDVKDDVQDMLDDPDNNFGFMLYLQVEDQPHTRLRFVSSDSSSKAPKLEVEFIPPNRYASLSEYPDGTYYNAYFGRLHFKYDEEYNASDLKYNIYDELHEVVFSDADQSLNKTFGRNWYTLNLNDDNDFVENDYYTLEVRDEYGESKYLRFKMKDEDNESTQTTQDSWILLKPPNGAID